LEGPRLLTDSGIYFLLGKGRAERVGLRDLYGLLAINFGSKTASIVDEKRCRKTVVAS
jgi:hypothetical protein